MSHILLWDVWVVESSWAKGSPDSTGGTAHQCFVHCVSIVAQLPPTNGHEWKKYPRTSTPKKIVCLAGVSRLQSFEKVKILQGP